MKPSFASSGVSSWRSLRWTEETLGFGLTGVCLPPLPLYYQYDTLLKQLLHTKADSFRRQSPYMVFSETLVMLDLVFFFPQFKIDLKCHNVTKAWGGTTGNAVTQMFSFTIFSLVLR